MGGGGVTRCKPRSYTSSFPRHRVKQAEVGRSNSPQASKRLSFGSSLKSLKRFSRFCDSARGNVPLLREFRIHSALIGVFFAVDRSNVRRIFIEIGSAGPKFLAVRGNRHHTRHLLNQEFIQALLLHFREHGKKAIEKVAREQPASYVKILALLVPREHKVEHRNFAADLTDEELDAAIEGIREMLAAQAENAKVIEGTAEAIALQPSTEPDQPLRKRRNRLLEHVDTAIGPRERGKRKPQ